MYKIEGTPWTVIIAQISHLEKVSANNFTLYLSGGAITNLTAAQITPLAQYFNVLP